MEAGGKGHSWGFFGVGGVGMRLLFSSFCLFFNVMIGMNCVDASLGSILRSDADIGDVCECWC